MLDIVKMNIKEELQKRLINVNIYVNFTINDLCISIVRDNDKWVCRYRDIADHFYYGLPSKQICRDCLKKYEKHILSLYFKK